MYIYIQLKKYDDAEKLLLIKIREGNADINDFYFTAYALLMKNNFEKAICFTRKALEIDSQNQPTLNLLGYCLIETANFEEAENALFNALEDKQTKPYSLNNLGYLKIITNRLEEGFELIEESLQLDASNGYAYLNRGIYYFKKEQFALAKKDLDKANDLEKDILHLNEWMQKLADKIA